MRVHLEHRFRLNKDEYNLLAGVVFFDHSLYVVITGVADNLVRHVGAGRLTEQMRLARWRVLKLWSR
jgi:hypothetical protein